jgi:hypothetical protein
MEDTETSPTTALPWEAYHDRECEQWQVIDEGETRVIATGVENEKDARFIVRACNGFEPILDAAKKVVERWEHGDLAAAVNQLQEAIKTYGNAA